MHQKQSAPLTHDKRPRKRGLAVFVSILFFAAITGLYTSFGTFLSSCGTPEPYDINLIVKIPQGIGCKPIFTGSYVNFGACVADNWKVRIDVLTPNATFSTYNFGPSLINNGATISGITIQKVKVPLGQTHMIRVAIHSKCNICGTSSHFAQWLFQSEVIPAGDYSTDIGPMWEADMILCQ